jgi:hypothetical protein
MVVGPRKLCILQLKEGGFEAFFDSGCSFCSSADEAFA